MLPYSRECRLCQLGRICRSLRSSLTAACHAGTWVAHRRKPLVPGWKNSDAIGVRLCKGLDDQSPRGARVGAVCTTKSPFSPLEPAKGRLTFPDPSLCYCLILWDCTS